MTPSQIYGLVLLAGWTLVSSLSAQEEDPVQKEIETALCTVVTLEFRETPFSSVADFFQSTLGIPIVLDPSLDPPLVTISLREVEVRDALDLLCSIAGLRWSVEDGAILVSSRETILARSVSTRVYDVRDLLVPIPDFPGKKVDLDLYSEVVEEVQLGSPEDSPRLYSEELSDLLLSTVQPESWDSGPVALRSWGGLLFVTHTPEAHEEIDAVLADLRSMAALVSVDARLYAVDEPVLAELLGDHPETSGAYVDAGARSRLDQQGTLLEQISLAGFNTQLVHGRSMRGRLYLKDFDTQVAQSAFALDPVIGLSAEGMSLAVRPILEPQKAGVVLDLDIQVVRSLESGPETPAALGESVPRVPGEEGSAGIPLAAGVGRGGTLRSRRAARAVVRTEVRVPAGMGALFLLSPSIAGEEKTGVLVVTPLPVE